MKRSVLLGYLTYTALTLWWVLGSVGPGRWLGELQLEYMGAASMVRGLLILHLPAVILLEEPFYLPAGSLAFGAIVAGFFWTPAVSEDRGPVSWQAAVADPDATFYAEVTGRRSESMTVQDKRDNLLFYVLDGDPAESEIRLVVTSKTGDGMLINDDGTYRVRGYVDRGLRSDVRAWLETSFERKVAQRALILDTDLYPTRSRWALGILVVALLGLEVLVVVGARQKPATDD